MRAWIDWIENNWFGWIKQFYFSIPVSLTHQFVWNRLEHTFELCICKTQMIYFPLFILAHGLCCVNSHLSCKWFLYIFLSAQDLKFAFPANKYHHRGPRIFVGLARPLKAAGSSYKYPWRFLYSVRSVNTKTITFCNGTFRVSLISQRDLTWFHLKASRMSKPNNMKR